MSNTVSEAMGGYLFAHFIGEETELSEQIYFSLSRNGLNFTDMNKLNPVLISNVGERGVRDPFLCRSHEGDKFFIIATDLSIHSRGGWFKNEQGYYDASTTGSRYLVLWESPDLINWSEPRLIDVAPQNAGMAWAPEIIYDEAASEYVIFFSSSIMDPVTKYKAKPNAIYCVRSRDMINFSNTELFIDNQDGREIIDTTILKINNFYYAVSKDGDNSEKGGGIVIHKSSDLKNWIKVLDLDDLCLDLSEAGVDVLDNSSLEGPELFLYNKSDWENPNVPEYGIIADRYMAGNGYLPLKTTDIEDKTGASWKVLSHNEYNFDRLKKRHGTILPLTKDEVQRLSKHFM